MWEVSDSDNILQEKHDKLVKEKNWNTFSKGLFIIKTSFNQQEQKSFYTYLPPES